MHYITAFLFASIVSQINAQICKDYWGGTATFCDADCDDRHDDIIHDRCGDGACCWTGEKAYCRCKPNQERECQNFWQGHAPFCAGSCPKGWTAIESSKTGDGSHCWTGQKVLCSQPGCRAACQPGAVDMNCFSFWSFLAPGLAIFDNGCSKSVGLCGTLGMKDDAEVDSVGHTDSGLSSEAASNILSALRNSSAARRPSIWNRTQLTSFLNSRYLDRQYDTNFTNETSWSDQNLKDLVRSHWYDKSYHNIRRNGVLDLPLQMSEEVVIPGEGEWGEVEGWFSATGPTEVPLLPWQVKNITGTCPSAEPPRNCTLPVESPGNCSLCVPYPDQNKCDSTSSCSSTPYGPMCSCSPGYKANAPGNASNIHWRLKWPVSGHEHRVYVTLGQKCDTLCDKWYLGAQGCQEVSVSNC
ncbi:hypothetical protein BKA65DRAFT_520766 [Rhexocercosporidium sp. MPI-PUGE-AT-0058]|nr:hypothetical protein BKA65DRAFT_520766 [Rhexocercosporidium sp. MPI-PUGE-AT-0058]